MVRSGVALRGMLLGALLVASAPLPGSAQELCAPVISALADTVLDHRQDLPPLQARRFGTRAIYLLARYGDLPDAEIAQLLDEALADRVHGADDLDFAWRVSRFGLEATVAERGPDALEKAVDSSRMASLRALALGGHADELMTAIASADDAQRITIGSALVTATFDQSDSVKQQLGEAASEHGLDWLAAGFAAAQTDPEAWARQVEGQPVEEVDRLASFWRWIPMFNGNPMLLLSTMPNDATASAQRNSIRLATWASAVQPEFDLLGTFLNQTGDYAVAGEVAKRVLKQFQGGTLSRTGPLDQGWLATYSAFNAAGLDADDVESLFGNASFGINRVGRATVSDILDWIVVVDALTPYLDGTAALPDSLPGNLSANFTRWSDWLRLAQLVRETPDVAIGHLVEDELPILAELLLAAGERQVLADMLDQALPSLVSTTLADDFAARLDRLCDAHLWHRGEAPMLAGRALYDFSSAIAE